MREQEPPASSALLLQPHPVAHTNKRHSYARVILLQPRIVRRAVTGGFGAVVLPIPVQGLCFLPALPRARLIPPTQLLLILQLLLSLFLRDFVSPRTLVAGEKGRKAFLASSLMTTTRENFTLLAVLLRVSAPCSHN